MAQTLKFGNGTWATKKGSTLAFNDEDGNYKPLPFATTRATSATRVNKEGLIEVVEGDRPRIDYTDSANGALLLEPQRLQKIQYSEAFDNAYWTKYKLSVVSGFTSLDGGLNAFKLIPNNAESITSCVLQENEVVTATSYSFTLFAKKGEYNNIRLNARDNTSAANYTQAEFNLATGIVTNGASAGTVTNLSANIIELPNGWYRCSLNFSVSLATTMRMRIYTGDSISTIGDGTSGVYIYGAQLEAGSYPSSYIPTQGSAVTRVADTASGSGNSEVFSDSSGVLFADIAALANDGTNRMISLSDGSSNNRILIKYDNITNRLEFFVFSGGVGEYSFITTSLITTSNSKIVFKYKQNDFAIWGNGFELDTNTSGNTPIGLSELAFDDGSGSNNFYGKTKELAYYNTALTDLELETLTSYRSWLSMVNELNLNVIYNG